MNSDARLRLEDLLDREIELAHSLAATLADEKTALTGDSAAMVERKAIEKTQLFQTFEKLESERRSLCADPSVPGLDSTVTTRWRSLMELMASCRYMNELNGHIIRVRQYQVGQLIDIVRGRPAAMTYGPQGKTFANAQRALARA
jgi:flagellar biosynthesis/type III secretory pathway chaperone